MMDTNYDRQLKSIEYDELMEYDKWFKKIPEIQFHSDWKVKITPPSCGAIVRFRVYKDKAEVSVYLDCYNILGRCGSPYWEIYPYREDVFRCPINDVESLLAAIEFSIKEQNDALNNKL